MSVTSYEPDYTYDFKPLYPRESDDLTPMYSFNAPSANFWHGVAYYLHKSGKTDDQIKDILASKHARWMMDAYSDEIAKLGQSIARKYFKTMKTD